MGVGGDGGVDSFSCQTQLLLSWVCDNKDSLKHKEGLKNIDISRVFFVGYITTHKVIITDVV